MSIYEYDAEKHMRQEREAEFERGLTEGITRGKIELIQKKLKKGDSITKIADDLLETEQTIQELAKMQLD